LTTYVLAVLVETFRVEVPGPCSIEVVRLVSSPEGAEKVSVTLPAKPKPPSPATLMGVCADDPVFREMTVASALNEKS